MEMFITVWVLLSALVGYIGYLREGSFRPAFVSSLLLSPLISGILTLLIPFKEVSEEELSKKRTKRTEVSPGVKIGVIVLIVIALTLPFHYIPGMWKVITKENLTFSNTFIFQSDVDRLVDRYNTSMDIEKTKIMDEPLYKLLREEHLITIQEHKESQ